MHSEKLIRDATKRLREFNEMLGCPVGRMCDPSYTESGTLIIHWDITLRDIALRGTGQSAANWLNVTHCFHFEPNEVMSLTVDAMRRVLKNRRDQTLILLLAKILPEYVEIMPGEEFKDGLDKLARFTGLYSVDEPTKPHTTKPGDTA